MTDFELRSNPPTGDAAIDSVFEAMQPVQRAESTIRMYFLDAALRLKLRSLLAAGLPMTLDAWRQSHDMDAVVASGIWPFISYVDLEVADVALAGGRLADFRSAIRAARTAQPQRSDGPIVLGTEVAIHAQLGGGNAGDFMHAAGGGQREWVGRLRSISNLVRPMAAPEERAVRVLPPQLAGLELVTSAAAPSTSVLLAPPAGFAPGASIETHTRWAQHHTDANQIVYTGEYLGFAEDTCGSLAHAAGLRPGGLRMLRGQIALKRPFLAGQEFWIRGRLFRAPDGPRAQALISFHGAAGPGQIDERASTAVRIDLGCAE
jgi:hypothetical protein